MQIFRLPIGAHVNDRIPLPMHVVTKRVRKIDRLEIYIDWYISIKYDSFMPENLLIRLYFWDGAKISNAFCREYHILFARPVIMIKIFWRE